jgi:hypothetical protein
MRLELYLTLTLLVGACSGNDKPKQESDPKLAIRLDAGVAVQRPTGPTGDPSAMHLDDDPGSRVVAPSTGNRAARDIEITLRSTPPGARVSVDGTPLGNTPAFCPCKADGREHEFLFTLPGHAIARYRFVPVSSGVIHARLDPIAEESDAGVPPPEVVPPQPIVPAQPQIPLAPIDAAIVAPVAPMIDAGASAPLPPTSGPQP